jgi:hypothetical protein
MKAIKKITNISDSKTISNGEGYTGRSKVKGVSIRGKMLLKMRNASHVIVIRGLTNRALELKPKLELLRLQIKVWERLTQCYNLKVIVSIQIYYS